MNTERPARYLFWASVWLAVALVAVKAAYLAVLIDLPGQLSPGSLLAISWRDVAFAAGYWACARLVLALLSRWRAASIVWASGFVASAAFFCLYAFSAVVVFGIFGGFLTYPLLALVGDIRMLSSSVAAYLTPLNVTGLIAVPAIFLAFVWISERLGRTRSG